MSGKTGDLKEHIKKTHRNTNILKQQRKQSFDKEPREYARNLNKVYCTLCQ